MDIVTLVLLGKGALAVLAAYCSYETLRLVREIWVKINSKK
jgi:hypothetical protein